MLRYILACIFVFSYVSIYACDICGCYMGITPYRNFSSFGLYYRYRAFNGYSSVDQKHDLFPSSVFRVAHGGHGHPSDSVPPSAQDGSSRDYELYRVYELRAKYFVHKRLELNGVFPLYFNSARITGVKEKANGFGDISLFAGYHLISKLDQESDFRHRLVAGGGIKLKTGEYYLKNREGLRIDPLLQPGTGSNDILTYANYLMGYKKAGFSLTALYKINTENYYHERIGNSITTYANLFYLFGENKLRVVPLLQLYHEYTKGMEVSGELVSGTRMHELMIGPGVDVYYDKFTVSASFQRPVFEHSDPERIGSAGRMVLGLSYNFIQKKHLLK